MKVESLYNSPNERDTPDAKRQCLYLRAIGWHQITDSPPMPVSGLKVDVNSKIFLYHIIVYRMPVANAFQ